MASQFLTALAARVGEGAILTDPSETRELGRDWTKVFEPNPMAVVVPRTTAEVSATLALANEHGVAVVPSGGRTGLAGGAVAKNGELVLSLSRMNALGPIDIVGRTLRVQAGAVTQAVHEHCAEVGLTWPVDFASKGSSHVGGNIATNAGGIRVIRYGLTRNWVLGLEVVLASGAVLAMDTALEKNNTGLDLKHLFIGSEGTLGVITAATLKLSKLARETDVMLFALADLAAVIALFRAAQDAPFVIQAFEFFTDKCLDRVTRHRKLTAPFSDAAPYYVVLEADRTAGNDAFLEGLFERGLVLDGTLAQHSSQAAQLWSLRESISESLSATGLPHKNDIALPVAALEAFCAELLALLGERYPGWEVCLFGHIGDGNLHVNVMKPDALDKAAFLSRTHDVDAAIFTLVKAHGGSISAEHGIGLLKRDYLGFSRSAQEIEAMRAIKHALDPNGILNPGKILTP